jgi:hypothetical protein
MNAASLEVRLFGSFTKACKALGLPYHYLKKFKSSSTEPIYHSGYYLWRVSAE